MNKKKFYKYYNGYYYAFFRVLIKKGLFYVLRRLPSFLFHYFCGIIIDYPLIIILGPKNTKKLYFALFKFRCKHNLFLKEKNLWLSQTILKNIYKISYVNPNKVKYALQLGTPFYIQSGDWDLKKRNLETNPAVNEITVRELFVDKIPYRETKQYKEAIKYHGWGKSSWFKTRRDLDSDFEKKILMYYNIKKSGYKTQEELKKQDKNGDYNIMNELRVSIDRNGNYILENAGSHRLAIAKLLKLKKIPVVVARIHYLRAKSIGLI